MSIINNENEINECEIILDSQPKRSRGRPKKIIDESDAKRSDVPLSKSKEYFKQYYKDTSIKVKCDKCQCQTNKRNL